MSTPLGRPQLHFTASFDESHGGVFTFIKNNISPDSVLFSQYISSRTHQECVFKVYSAYNLFLYSRLISTGTPFVFLHGLFSPYLLFLLLITKVLRPSLSLSIYPHGMLYPSVLKSRKVLLKRIWLRIFCFLVNDKSKFFCLSPEEYRHEKIFPMLTNYFAEIFYKKPYCPPF